MGLRILLRFGGKRQRLCSKERKPFGEKTEVDEDKYDSSRGKFHGQDDREQALISAQHAHHFVHLRRTTSLPLHSRPTIVGSTLQSPNRETKPRTTQSVVFARRNARYRESQRVESLGDRMAEGAYFAGRHAWKLPPVMCV